MLVSKLKKSEYCQVHGQNALRNGEPGGTGDRAVRESASQGFSVYLLYLGTKYTRIIK